MHKPEYLYHGARRKLEIVEPSQGIGPGEIDNEFGVYAVSKLEWAILFAFTFYPIGKGVVDCYMQTIHGSRMAINTIISKKTSLQKLN